MSLLDPTDRDLAKKRAREAAEADLVGLDSYIKENPTLDAEGFPIDPVADSFDALYNTLYLSDGTHPDLGDDLGDDEYADWAAAFLADEEN